MSNRDSSTMTTLDRRGFLTLFLLSAVPNPLFDVAVSQLENTKLSKATQGCLLGVMPQARKASEDGLEAALNGTDPQQAMTKAAESLSAQIKQYNDSVG